MTNKDILIDLPMPITTPRLIIRPAMPGDGAALYEAKKETWGMLNRWMMPWAKEIGTEEDSEAVVREAYAKFILREDLMMIGFRREDDVPVVYTGLHRFNWSIRKFEIGYWVRRSAQGQGYATEATNALTRYAFDELKAKRVQISHADGNDASRNVIEKLGFEKEAIRRFDTELPNGEIVSSHDYARFNTDNLPPLEVTWS